jgi:hypothetical protein
MPEEEFKQNPVAPPPPPEIGLRTMQSDIKSVQAGEAAPSPEAVLPPELESVMEKPETVNQMPGAVVSPAGGRKPVKMVLLVLGIAVLAGGLGVFGYYVVYPLVFPAPTISPQPPQAAQPAPLAEAPASVPVMAPHQTYFVNAPAATAEIKLESVDSDSITAALQTETLDRLPDNSVKEVVMLDANGSQISSNSLFNALLGTTIDIPADKSEWLFEDDFTAFVYYDANGVWPGYIAKAKVPQPAEAATDVPGLLEQIENADLSLFYIQPAADFAEFKDGQYKTFATRYAVGPAGASFNYGVFGDYAVISASFGGLKAAAALLGL